MEEETQKGKKKKASRFLYSASVAPAHVDFNWNDSCCAARGALCTCLSLSNRIQN
jgi:hypothetical protein